MNALCSAIVPRCENALRPSPYNTPQALVVVTRTLQCGSDSKITTSSHALFSVSKQEAQLMPTNPRDAMSVDSIDRESGFYEFYLVF